MALRTKKHKTPPQKTPKNKSSTESRAKDALTFTHHIRELRRRLFLIVAASVVVGSLVYYYHDFFIKLVMAPLNGQKLVYLTPVGGFSFIFMVTFYATILVVLPLILYQIYAFIRPAIPRHTSRLSLKIGLAATLLMAGGATFGYMFAVPAGLDFLNGFAGDYVTPSLTADSYLSFVLGYVLGIGVLFELPLLLLFWHWIHPLTPKGLLNSERFVIVGAFIAAAILSPSPDALSQTIIAVPIIIVYQFGVIAVLISLRKARKSKESEKQTVHSQPVEQVVPTTLSTPPRMIPAPESTPMTVSRPVPRRKVVSVDGMVNHRPASMAAQAATAPTTPKPISPRPRPALVVPRRTHVISDFGPIRSSVVDTGR